MNNRLLVEGKDDFYVVKAFRERFNIPNNFTVIDKEGYTKLKEGLPLEIKADADNSTNVIGVIVDADENIETRWQEIKNIFEQKGYPMPEMPVSNGTIISHPDSSTNQPLSIGVWIMPNNVISGELEDFMAMLISQDDQLISIATDSINKIQKEVDENLRFPNSSRSKALIYTYLAWQKEPGKTIAQSITKKYFDADAALAKQFVKWLNDLFNAEPDNQ